MRSERDLHDQFNAWLKKSGYPFIHSRMDRATSMTCGDPDYAVCVNGRVAFVEFKFGKGKLSQVQVERIAELENAGNIVLVARSIEAAVDHVMTALGQSGAATEALVQPFSPSTKLYLTGSRDLGDIVVRRVDGKMNYVRLANGQEDLALPRWMWGME